MDEEGEVTLVEMVYDGAFGMEMESVELVEGGGV